MPFQQYPSKGGVPSGTTAQRPSNPVIGDQYYDGDIGFLIIWDGSKWLPCSAPAAQPTIAVTDVGTNVAYGTVQGSVAFTEGTSGGKAAGFTGIQGSYTTTGTSSTQVVVITGTPGSYIFSGTAYNGFGTSPAAVSVTQTLTSVPQAPTIGTASVATTAADGANSDASVTWTLNANGGKNLTAIKVKAYSGATLVSTTTAATTSSTSATITGLTAGTAYTFKVFASNANGDSADSSASNSVTMQAAAAFVVVAGGGGACGSGDAWTTSGGAGAGGFRTSAGTSGRNSSAENPFLYTPGTSYTITVGGGGSGSASYSNTPTNGSNSVLSSITSIGGGGSGNYSTYAQNGGCGGSAGASSTDAYKVPGNGTAGQGFDGTAGHNYSQNYTNSGAGGAGAGGTGGSGLSTSTGGTGGTGIATTISGSSVTYAGGGGGGSFTTGGTGGTGGGGNGGGLNTAGSNGSSNTGGGGGGSSVTTTASMTRAGGNGGSGIIIIKVPNTRSATFSGGVTQTMSTAVSGYKIYTVTAAGSGDTVTIS